MRRFEIATYEWQGETRYDIGAHAFLTGDDARRLAQRILTTVRMTEMMEARNERRPGPEGATVGKMSV